MRHDHAPPASPIPCPTFLWKEATSHSLLEFIAPTTKVKDRSTNQTSSWNDWSTTLVVVSEADDHATPSPERVCLVSCSLTEIIRSALFSQSTLSVVYRFCWLSISGRQERLASSTVRSDWTWSLQSECIRRALTELCPTSMRRSRDVFIVVYQVCWLRSRPDTFWNPAHGEWKAIGPGACNLDASGGLWQSSGPTSMRRSRDVFIVVYQVCWLRPRPDTFRNPAHGEWKAIGPGACNLDASGGLWQSSGPTSMRRNRDVFIVVYQVCWLRPRPDTTRNPHEQWETIGPGAYNLDALAEPFCWLRPRPDTPRNPHGQLETIGPGDYNLDALAGLRQISGPISMRRIRDVSSVTYQVRWLQPRLDIPCNPTHGKWKAIGLEACGSRAASSGVSGSFLMRLALSSQPGEDDRVWSSRQEDVRLSDAAKVVATCIHLMSSVDWF